MASLGRVLLRGGLRLLLQLPITCGHTPMTPSKYRPRDPSPPSPGLTCALLMERMGGFGDRTQEEVRVLHEPKAWRGA